MFGRTKLETDNKLPAWYNTWMEDNSTKCDEDSDDDTYVSDDEDDEDFEEMAMEIHNAYKKIDTQKYLDTTKDFVNSDTINTTLAVMENLLYNHLSDEQIRVCVEPLIMRISKSYDELSVPTKEIITQTTRLINSKTFLTEHQKKLYATMFMTENTEAYGSHMDNTNPGPCKLDVNTVCIGGIVERIVTVLGNVLQTIQEKTELQQKVLNIITAQTSKPDFTELYKGWKEQLSGEVKDIVSKLKEEKPINSEETTKLINSFKCYARTQGLSEGELEEKTMKDKIDYMPQFIQDGGKRKKRVTRKVRVKTIKQKNKMKANRSRRSTKKRLKTNRQKSKN